MVYADDKLTLSAPAVRQQLSLLADSEFASVYERVKSVPGYLIVRNTLRFAGVVLLLSFSFSKGCFKSERTEKMH